MIPAHAADEACKVFIDVSRKLATTPTHTYKVRVAGFKANKPENSEAIYSGGALYIMVGGTWRRSKTNLADSVKEQEEKLRTSKQTCRYARDEAVNGEADTVYTAHNDTDAGTMDITIWISKSSGLPLREEANTDVGAGAAGKSHITTRFEYTNVHAPAGVQ